MAEEYDDGMNRHGFPQGTNFAPKPPELIELLSDRLAGGPLPKPLGDVFNEVNVLDSHPSELYKTYKNSMEVERYIYFFSLRKPQPGSNKNAVRRVPTGTWKPSGGGKEVKTGGGLTGEMHTIVYYEEGEKKTDWAMNEFTLKLPDKTVASMAVYRLYVMKKGDRSNDKEEQGGGGQAQSCSQQALDVAEGCIADDASDEWSECDMQADGSLWAGAAGESAEAVWGDWRAALQQEESPASVEPLQAVNCSPWQQQAAVALPTHWSGHAVQWQPPPAAAAGHADDFSTFSEWYKIQPEASPPAGANETALPDARDECCPAKQETSPLPSGFAAPKDDDTELRWEDEFQMYRDIHLDDLSFTMDELCGG